MRESVYADQDFHGAYRIDEEFLRCLEAIALEYDQKATMSIRIYCENGMEYDFDNLEEFLDFFESHPVFVNEMKICVSIRKEGSYRTDSVEISLGNDWYSTGPKVGYRFASGDTYFVVKNKIDALLSSKRQSYSPLVNIPIVAVAGAAGFWGIVLYTKLANIVFPLWLQYLIAAISLFCIISPFSSRVRKAKKHFFPISQFYFGVNTARIKRYEGFRGLIGKGILLALVVGLLTDALTQWFF